MKLLSKFVGAVVDVGLALSEIDLFKIGGGECYFSGEEFWQIDDLSFLLIDYFGFGQEKLYLKIINKIRGNDCLVPYLGDDLSILDEVKSVQDLIDLQDGLLAARVDLGNFFMKYPQHRYAIRHLMKEAITLDLKFRISDDYERGDYKGTFASHLINLFEIHRYDGVEGSPGEYNLDDFPIYLIDQFAVDYFFKLYPYFHVGRGSKYDAGVLISVHFTGAAGLYTTLGINSLFLFLEKRGGDQKMKDMIFKYFFIEHMRLDDVLDLSTDNLLGIFEDFSNEAQHKLFDYLMDYYKRKIYG
jgi:hypothetical protein